MDEATLEELIERVTRLTLERDAMRTQCRELSQEIEALAKRARELQKEIDSEA